MLILYKNDRNVRFVLFMKTSNDNEAKYGKMARETFHQFLSNADGITNLNKYVHKKNRLNFFELKCK